MRICKTLVIALSLLVPAALAYANPPANSVYDGKATACPAKEDAQQVATLAGANYEKSLDLLQSKIDAGKCGLYESIFVVTEVMKFRGRIWVLKVAPPTGGNLYILYLYEAAKKKWPV